LLVLRQFLKIDYRGLVILDALRQCFPCALYQQRCHIESGFSQHKRRPGSALTARGHQA